MNVLIACEESQRVCKAFLEKGHNAYSCDLEKCGGGIKDRHILMDALMVINGGVMRLESGKKIEIPKWDLIIAHPPCTYLSNVTTRHHSISRTPINWINGRTLARIQAMEFFMRFINAPCEKIAVENPAGIMNTAYRKADQIIEPYQFADSEEDIENYVTKKTCLWLKGLPLLVGNELPRPDNKKMFGKWSSGKSKNWEETRGGNRSRERSKTFPGIAKAMAEQWG